MNADYLLERAARARRSAKISRWAAAGIGALAALFLVFGVIILTNGGSPVTLICAFIQGAAAFNCLASASNFDTSARNYETTARRITWTA